jgi:FtsZ-binding cell division protein ZapB
MVPETHQSYEFPTRAASEPDTHESASRPRLRFWEFDRCFKCPVVGMCLTTSEQKHLIKKVGVSIKKKSPFELHEILVASAESENRLSLKIDNLLQRKFGKLAETLTALDDAAFMAHFKAAFDAGDCVAILWAAAINPDLPIELKRHIFGEIHMAMHWSGEQSLMLKRRQSRQQRELEDLQGRLNTISRERRAVRKQSDALRHCNAGLQADLAALKAENARLAAAAAPQSDSLSRFETERIALADTIAELRAQLKRKQRQVEALKKKNRHLRTEAGQHKDASKRIQAETKSILAEMRSMNRCDASCPAFDLCKKRILIVGGVTRMETLYRELIEGSGGHFDYHDGYMKNGVRQLESRLRRADVVLCPVNCNSHAACSLVKNLGKKHKTPVHLLPNSSLTTVSHVIWGDRASRVNLN